MGVLLYAAASVGYIVLLYLFIKTAFIVHLYTRRSSLPRYLHNDAYALITGASDGIGFGFAQELLTRGFNVILHGRNPSKLSGIKSDLQKQFPNRKIEFIVADASSSKTDIADLFEAVKDKPITVLINCIGGIFYYPKMKSVKDTPADEMDGNINLNARFPLQVTRALLPILERNTPSLVMTLGTMASLAGAPLYAAYAASKASTITFSHSLRHEMRREGTEIEVLAIQVGEVRSTGNPAARSFWVPSSRQFACSALNRVGCGYPTVFAAFPHYLQNLMGMCIPTSVLDEIVLRICRGRFEKQTKGE
jgi:17beta-estradiol 17-dehydrogenase / very-long-chain 3-oxoacyl-CoA reductase